MCCAEQQMARKVVQRYPELRLFTLNYVIYDKITAPYLRFTLLSNYLRYTNSARTELQHTARQQNISAAACCHTAGVASGK